MDKILDVAKVWIILIALGYSFIADADAETKKCAKDYPFVGLYLDAGKK